MSVPNEYSIECEDCGCYNIKPVKCEDCWKKIFKAEVMKWMKELEGSQPESAWFELKVKLEKL
jgi:hypothetical protein